MRAWVVAGIAGAAVVALGLLATSPDKAAHEPSRAPESRDALPALRPESPPAVQVDARRRDATTAADNARPARGPLPSLPARPLPRSATINAPPVEIDPADLASAESMRLAVEEASRADTLAVIEGLDATPEQKARLREIHLEFTEREHANLDRESWEALGSQRDALETELLGADAAETYRYEREYRRVRIAKEYMDAFIER